MDQLSSIDDNFYMDSADSVVNYFLSNATGWRGDTAKRVKSELKGMVQRRQAGPPQGGYPEQGTHGQGWDSPEPSDERPDDVDPVDEGALYGETLRGAPLPDMLESYYRTVHGLKPSRRAAFDAGHQHPGHTAPYDAPEDEWGVTDDDASGMPGSKDDYYDSWENDPDQVND